MDVKVYGDDYCTVVARNLKEAQELFLSQDLNDLEGIQNVREVDPTKRKMLFNISKLPEKYHDESKYPQQSWGGHYDGVLITLAEAMEYERQSIPYILSVDSDFL